MTGTRAVNLDEITAWRPFTDSDGNTVDLSFLDAHKVTYVHRKDGCQDINYEFWVTYSFHCFAKDYDHLSDEDRQRLKYDAGKDTRPFCYTRYELAKAYLRPTIEALGSEDVLVMHAGYESYAATKIVDSNGVDKWYYVPFVVYRYQKKFRIHVTSAYPVGDRPGGGKVRFFVIAHNLKTGKPLPLPPKKR